MQVSGSFTLPWKRLLKQKSKNFKEKTCFKVLHAKLKTGVSKNSGKLALE